MLGRSSTMRGMMAAMVMAALGGASSAVAAPRDPGRRGAVPDPYSMGFLPARVAPSRNGGRRVGHSNRAHKRQALKARNVARFKRSARGNR